MVPYTSERGFPKCNGVLPPAEEHSLTFNKRMMMMVVVVMMMKMMMVPLRKQSFLWSVQALTGARGSSVLPVRGTGV